MYFTMSVTIYKVNLKNNNKIFNEIIIKTNESKMRLKLEIMSKLLRFYRILYILCFAS